MRQINDTITLNLIVSIHASVKDATILLIELKYSTFVSIHASVKDATNLCSAISTYVSCLNPRIRKGCDEVVFDDLFSGKVSIHASVKDATDPYLG